MGVPLLDLTAGPDPPTGSRCVGRLAPSPTGLLHLGHARSFLAAWWQARAQGGAVRLRIDDLDRTRSRDAFADAARRDLEWLGVDWDGPVLRQSERGAAYADALERLRERGELYPCVCTRAELQASAGAPHASDGTPRYPGTCRGRYQDLADAEARSGRRAAWRWRVPEGEVRFLDGLAGPVVEDVAAFVGDIALTTRDGDVGYQLAVVVDDAHQGVTDVVRGDDLLPSTARQALLARALGLPHPRTWHLPLVTDAGGRRLAKRRADLGLQHLREAGVPAGRVVAWAARSLGLGELPDAPAGSAHPAMGLAPAWTARFRTERVPREAVVAPDLLADSPPDRASDPGGEPAVDPGPRAPGSP